MNRRSLFKAMAAAPVAAVVPVAPAMATGGMTIGWGVLGEAGAEMILPLSRAMKVYDMPTPLTIHGKGSLTFDQFDFPPSDEKWQRWWAGSGPLDIPATYWGA